MVKNVTQIKSGTTIIVNVSVKTQEDIMCAKKDCTWNSSTCTYENGEYLRIIIGDSVITCNEIIKKAKTIPTNFTENKVTWKRGYFYILLTFLLTTISLLIAVSIYCCFIKNRPKQRHLLQYHDTNNKFKETDFNNII